MAPRSKISKLPKPVKDWLDGALIQNNFGEYELLSAELKTRGFDLSKSAIHRYGQQFEERLRAVKLATEQAAAIAASSPDDAGAMNDALIRLVQEKTFQTLLKMEEGAPLKEVGLMVARLSNATVKQKQWAIEMRAKVAVAEDAVLAIAKKGGLSAEALEEIKRGFLGIAT
ncbi:MAG TPA: DUF3486 family protein [Gallionella sp.]|nr:DUF3486 family protein [Gallionella sp.]